MAKSPRGLQREINASRKVKTAAVMAKQPKPDPDLARLRIAGEVLQAERDALRAELKDLRDQLNAESLQHARNLRVLAYWLLRAYAAVRREGWEEGPTESETWVRVIDVLACIGVDPSTAPGRYLLKHPPTRLHPNQDVDAMREFFPDPPAR